MLPPARAASRPLPCVVALFSTKRELSMCVYSSRERRAAAACLEFLRGYDFIRI